MTDAEKIESLEWEIKHLQSQVEIDRYYLKLADERNKKLHRRCQRAEGAMQSNRWYTYGLEIGREKREELRRQRNQFARCVDLLATASLSLSNIYYDSEKKRHGDKPYCGFEHFAVRAWQQLSWARKSLDVEGEDGSFIAKEARKIFPRHEHADRYFRRCWDAITGAALPDGVGGMVIIDDIQDESETPEQRAKLRRSSSQVRGELTQKPTEEEANKHREDPHVGTSEYFKRKLAEAFMASCVYLPKAIFTSDFREKMQKTSGLRIHETD